SLVAFSSPIVIHVHEFSSSDPPQRRNRSRRSTVYSPGISFRACQSKYRKPYSIATQTQRQATTRNVENDSLAKQVPKPLAKTSRIKPTQNLPTDVRKTLLYQAMSVEHVALRPPAASPLNHRQNVEETVAASCNRNTSDSTSNSSTHNIPISKYDDLSYTFVRDVTEGPQRS
ncbi:unnamed protein product, partial [Ectocarpus sp. 12 AP-2014]